METAKQAVTDFIRRASVAVDGNMSSVGDKVSSIISKLPFGGADEKAISLPSEDEIKTLREKYDKAEQGHVFKFYDELPNDQKAELFAQLSAIDPQHINEITKKALQPAASEKPTIEPLSDDAYSSLKDRGTVEKSWYDAGLQQIGQNKVAVVLMAGGQGTRLGSSAPKGCFDIGLPSHKSLFQLQAERIFKIQKLGKGVVPWYVMTSGPTRKPTEEFFEKHNYFGLDKANVIIFEQGVLPCISNEGKILLETKGKVAVAPDGNGGIYQALVTSGVLADMRKRNIAHIHAYCVDNCLVKVADPVFIGFSVEKKVDIATKVVPKRAPNESVGLIVSKNGRPDVVEYSEIDKALTEEKDPKDSSQLKYRAANIVNHYYSMEFLESAQNWMRNLPHHVAKKKIPCIDIDSGDSIKPEKPNGIKLEQFVFDVFPQLEMSQFACLEVAREDEFSPLKNASGTGEDDPETSKRDITAQGARWVKEAGATVTSETLDDSGIEVSPLVSYGGEGLSFLSGREIRAPAAIDKPE